MTKNNNNTVSNSALTVWNCPLHVLLTHPQLSYVVISDIASISFSRYSRSTVYQWSFHCCQVITDLTYNFVKWHVQVMQIIQKFFLPKQNFKIWNTLKLEIVNYIGNSSKQDTVATKKNDIPTHSFGVLRYLKQKKWFSILALTKLSYIIMISVKFKLMLAVKSSDGLSWLQLCTCH